MARSVHGRGSRPSVAAEGWPFECAIDGIAVRDDFDGDECDCDHRINEPHDEECPAAEDGEYEEGLAGNDVFIVEGDQERYGNKSAWGSRPALLKTA